jgi:hypothetical protein
MVRTARAWPWTTWCGAALSLHTACTTPESIRASPAPAPTPAPAPASANPFGSEEADHLLFPEAADALDARAACRADKPERERIRCLIALRYRDDAVAADLALDLYAQSGSIPGLDVAKDFDGKYRGLLHFVPALPIAGERRHLEWVSFAFRDYEAFFRDLGVTSDTLFRWRTLALRFFRSVGVPTPSAYAEGWAIAYNVAGTLNASPESVRETLFHELFHLNDEFHRAWSSRTLAVDYAAIVKRCHASKACLAPYAPSRSMAHGASGDAGSTYYAFHPANTVEEYAAEVALRYYREQRAALHHETLAEPPFKCGPDENGRAWRALASEFFAGVDHVGACAPSASSRSSAR